MFSQFKYSILTGCEGSRIRKFCTKVINREYFEFKDPYKFRCGFCLLLLTQGSNKVKTKLKGSNCVIDH